MRPVDIEAASRLFSGAAFNAALWVIVSDEPQVVLPRLSPLSASWQKGFLQLVAEYRSAVNPAKIPRFQFAVL